MLKLLVVIANFGTKNDGYLRELIKEYRSLPYEVHITVLTNLEKQVEGATEVVVHRPSGNPWTFPFAHKAILADRVDQYDLFIYSEDDTLIKQDNIEAFLTATEVLAVDEIAGFLRVEKTPEGRTSVSTINGHFHWDPMSVVKRDQYTFAYFTNEHAACYLLTRQQLKRAIQSGGFLVEPHEERYDLLVTAATDPYTQCGFRKLVCISHIERFLIAHLPNKYVGQFGIECDEFQTQLKALKEIGEGSRSPTVLLRTETRLWQQKWSKSFYDPPSQDVKAVIAGHTGTVLSYGCGNGTFESELKAQGLEITAVPLDCVVGASVEAKGIEVIYGDTDSIWRALDGRRFNCVLALDLLHLVPQPSRLLEQLARLLTYNGSIIASAPNIVQARTLWKRMKSDPALAALGDYEQSGVHAASYWTMKRWFEAAGLKVKAVTPTPPESKLWWYRAAGQLFPPGFAEDFIVQGARVN